MGRGMAWNGSLGALLVMVSACGQSGGPLTGAGAADDAAVEGPIARFTGVAPEVTVPGPYAVSDARDYRYAPIDGTRTVDDTGARAAVFPVPMDVKGVVRYPLVDADHPVPAGGFPVLLFQHGRHSSCSTTGDAGGTESSGTDCEADGRVAIRSDRGYDYLAQTLASQGYVVLSIDANDINAQDAGSNDQGITARAELILHHLDLFRDIAMQPASAYRVDLDGQDFGALVGALDFNHVGLMGHSRGGNAVSKTVRFNRARPVEGDFDDPHALVAVFALAPTDFRNELPDNTVWATLSPYCDGDVSTLHGVYMYDNVRYQPDNISGLQYQLTVMGANHNFFNDFWFNDDAALNVFDPFCSTASPVSGRLDRDQQRALGHFLMSSFFRRFVGGETAFAGYWDAREQLPPGACPDGVVGCDAIVHLAFHQPPDRRLTVDTTLTSESLVSNALGRTTAYEGVLRSGHCEPNGSSTADLLGLAPDACPSPATISKAPQVFLDWLGAAAQVRYDLGDVDVNEFDLLSLRMGVSVLPVNALGQDFTLTLTDTHGTEVSARASAFSDALYFPPGLTVSARDTGAKTVINMVPFRLDAAVWRDSALDLRHLAEIRLRFDQRLAGMVQLTDVQFQRLPPR